MSVVGAAPSAAAAATRRWTVTPLLLGHRQAHASWFGYLEPGSVTLRIAYRSWLLRNGDAVIVVDTGPPLDEARVRGLAGVVSVAHRLAEHGVAAADVPCVVLTHLHWDHAAAADCFPGARFYAQRAEIEFFASRAWEHPSTARFFSHRDLLQGLIDARRIVAVDGDRELCSGVSLLRVGGHTPGSQMVVVDTEEGRAVLTGDAVPTHRNYVDDLPSGILVDLLELIQARQTVKALAPRFLYTGHDLADRLDCAANLTSNDRRPI